MLWIAADVKVDAAVALRYGGLRTARGHRQDIERYAPPPQSEHLPRAAYRHAAARGRIAFGDPKKAPGHSTRLCVEGVVVVLGGKLGRSPRDEP